MDNFGKPTRSDMITVGHLAQQSSGIILVIGDQPLFCEALQITLSDSLGPPQVATTSSLEAGLDGLTRLRNIAPGVPVVVVSSMSDDRIIAAVMHAGAAGCVPKHSPRDAFVAAIGTALQGGTYTPDGYTAPVPPRQKQPNAAPSTVWRI